MKAISRLVAGAALMGTLCGQCFAGDAVNVRIQLEINGHEIPAAVWVSGIPEGMPPHVPAAADPENVKLTEPDNILIIKGFTGKMEDVIKTLQVLTGGQDG